MQVDHAFGEKGLVWILLSIDYIWCKVVSSPFIKSSVNDAMNSESNLMSRFRSTSIRLVFGQNSRTTQMLFGNWIIPTKEFFWICLMVYLLKNYPKSYSRCHALIWSFVSIPTLWLGSTLWAFVHSVSPWWPQWHLCTMQSEVIVVWIYFLVKNLCLGYL
jgi:hypothetical protein